MSLAEFQRAFADLVASPDRCLRLRAAEDDILLEYDLTPRERRRLETMVRDEAMSVNCSLYRVNRLTPIYSVLPHTCRLLGDRLMRELEAFWTASRHATLQYRWEAWRFGEFLRDRLDAGLIPGGAVGDAIRLELALFDCQAAPRGNAAAMDDKTGNRQRVLRLSYDPDALLNPALPADAIEQVAGGVTVLVDATGEEPVIRLVAPWPESSS